MVIAGINCEQLFIQYMILVTTHMLDQLPPAMLCCPAVRCVMRIVEYCSEV